MIKVRCDHRMLRSKTHQFQMYQLISSFPIRFRITSRYSSVRDKYMKSEGGFKWGAGKFLSFRISSYVSKRLKTLDPLYEYTFRELIKPGYVKDVGISHKSEKLIVDVHAIGNIKFRLYSGTDVIIRKSTIKPEYHWRHVPTFNSSFRITQWSSVSHVRRDLNNISRFHKAYYKRNPIGLGFRVSNHRDGTVIEREQSVHTSGWGRMMDCIEGFRILNNTNPF